MQALPAPLNEPTTWVLIVVGLVILVAVVGFIARQVMCAIRLSLIGVVLILVLYVGARLLGG